MRALILCLALIPLFSLGVRTASAQSVSGPYSFELIDEAGVPLPTFWKGGRTYVLGSRGQRYSLRIHNRSAQRVEFVASVDGRDVIGGQPASWDKRGYLVAPWDDVVIDGFRLDHESVAAFRFGSVKDSYAARMGDAREVGVIGVAVFTEQQPRYRASSGWFGSPRPMPAESPAQGRLSELEAAPPSAAASAGAMADSRAARKAERPGLGTEFGEQRSSHVDEVAFERASSHPAATLSLRYNDRQGLRAMGVNVDPAVGPREADLRESANPFPGNFCAPPPGWSR